MIFKNYTVKPTHWEENDQDDKGTWIPVLWKIAESTGRNESERALSSDIATAWKKGFHYQKFESESTSRN